MTGPGPRYSAEEVARRGDELYENRIRAQEEAGNQGKVVAIDVLTGAYAVGENALAASKQLSAQQPDAQIWLVRIAHRGLHRIGSWFFEAQMAHAPASGAASARR
jgi:hypothetical protein